MRVADKIILLVGVFIFVSIGLVSVANGENSFSFTCDRIAQAMPSDSGAFFYAYLKNTGNQTDTYTIVKIDNVPDSWFTVFCVDSLCLWDSTDVTLAPGDSSSVRPEVFPMGNSGNGETIMRITSHNNPADIKELQFRIATGFQTLLINMGSEENQYRSYFDNALSQEGFDYNYWDINFSSFLDIDLINFERLIAYSGDRMADIISNNEISAIEAFFNSGGDLLVTGQGFASSLEGNAFLGNGLGVNYVTTYSGLLDITGIAGDPIGDGFQFSLTGGEGAGNQTEPDVIQQAGGTAAFEYNSGQIAGIKKEGNGYKSVFLPFGLEAVSETITRGQIIAAAFQWFGQATSIDDDNKSLMPVSFASLSNYPNPFNAKTTITIQGEINRYDMSTAVIEIFNVNGRKVAEINADGNSRNIIWEGSNGSGEGVATGLYYYRLKTSSLESKFQKMMLLK